MTNTAAPTLVACDKCSEKVVLEKAFHRRVRGFLCEACQAERMRNSWIVFWIALAGFMMFVGSAKVSESSRADTSWDYISSESRMTSADGTEITNLELRPAGPPTDANHVFDGNWRNEIETGIVSKIRMIGGYLHDLPFDYSEVLSYDGVVIRNTPESLLVLLRSPDGNHYYEIKSWKTFEPSLPEKVE